MKKNISLTPKPTIHVYEGNVTITHEQDTLVSEDFFLKHYVHAHKVHIEWVTSAESLENNFLGKAQLKDTEREKITAEIIRSFDNQVGI